MRVDDVASEICLALSGGGGDGRGGIGGGSGVAAALCSGSGCWGILWDNGLWWGPLSAGGGTCGVRVRGDAEISPSGRVRRRRAPDVWDVRRDLRGGRADVGVRCL